MNFLHGFKGRWGNGNIGKRLIEHLFLVFVQSVFSLVHVETINFSNVGFIYAVSIGRSITLEYLLSP